MLTSGVAFSTEHKTNFCSSLSKLSQDEITDRFLDKLFVNEFDEFYVLLTKIREGEPECFRAGVIIGENGRQFGANTYDVIESFSSLVDNDLELFLNNSRTYNLSDAFLIRVLGVPDWMFARVKIKEIKDTIMRRESNIKKITSNKKVINEVLKQYQDTRKRLDIVAETNLEYFHHSGARIVYSSKKKSLKSDKEYSLDNLVDNSANTAWCVLNDNKVDWGYLWVSFDLDELDASKFTCRNSSELSGNNECYLEEVVMGIRSGYQKNKHVFENNSRPSQITGTMRLKSKGGDYKTVLTLSDLDKKINEAKLTFPSQRWVSRSLTPIKIKIDFNKVIIGNKFDEMCISDISFELKGAPDQR